MDWVEMTYTGGGDWLSRSWITMTTEYVIKTKVVVDYNDGTTPSGGMDGSWSYPNMLIIVN